ncbi:MAG: glutamate formimidoyltransferase [Oscillospiraceae bacterium]|nr:glutamate formimidoyltransferase [Oscillospiraceae bacterium]
MTPKLMECVPNISEGRDMSVVRAVADAVRGVTGVVLMDCSSDADHNRSVVSFMGEPPAVERAAVLLAGRAAELIDLTKHTGVHPRMGAADVIPFIPIRGMEMSECAEASRRAARRIFSLHAVPVYLYAHSASAPRRVNLADIRRGGFEGMAEKVRLPGWEPDFGVAPHPTAGVTAVGARAPLIAFNVNLGTPDLSAAKAIAKAIRESSGGLPRVKALGLMLESRAAAQVSVNLTDWRVTPPRAVFDAVAAQAARLGVKAVSSEIVGLAPAGALPDGDAIHIRLEGFDFKRQILESYM